MILLAALLLAEARPPAWSTTPWARAPIASADFESHPAFDRAGGRLYFVRSSPEFRGWKILEATCHAGRWSEPKPPSFAGVGVEADPFLTDDGKTLFFISSRKEDGVEGRGLDLWRVDRPRPSAPWGKPQRLPEPLNSAGNEWFPRLASDGWLYFGSDRPGGHGQTDIYRGRQVGGRWQVENLGAEVNSASDEYEADISRDGRRMILMADGDLFLVKSSHGRWHERVKLSPEINSAQMEVGALFSPNGTSFLFARDLGRGRGSGEFLLARKGKNENWPPRCG